MEEKSVIPTAQEIRAALELRHTKAVQDRLSDARVAVCGLGGLGSAVAISLARCGVGRLHLIDFDRVDLSNLNRQQYAIDQLGRPKPEACRRNPPVRAVYRAADGFREGYRR